MGSHSVACYPAEVRIPQPKQVLDLATPEGWKAELTYVTRKRTGRELNPRPLSVHRPTAAPPRRMSASRRCDVDMRNAACNTECREYAKIADEK